MTEAPDRPARGRTRAGRLARLDRFLVEVEWDALVARAGPSPLVVDVGLGARPDTTLELRAALASRAPGVRVIGVERDAGWAEEAARAAGGLVEVRTGGFDLPLDDEERPVLVRVLNVLRSYRADEVAPAHAALGSRVLEGGLVVEGSADPGGDRLGAWLLRKTGGALVREGLVLVSGFAHGFAPWQLRDWLPRDVRRGLGPGHPVFDLFAAWHAAWEEVRAQGARTPAEGFVRSLDLLGTRVPDVSPVPSAGGGVLVWRPSGGVDVARASDRVAPLRGGTPR